MMSDQVFNPQQFIGRKHEQSIFQEMLQFTDAARVLAVRDSGGKGKSQLLKQFYYLCETAEPTVAASLVALDQLPDETPLSLVQTTVTDLVGAAVDFPRYTYYEKARLHGDFAAIQSSSYLQGTDSQLSSNAVNTTTPDDELNMQGRSRASVVNLSPEQDVAAQEVSLKAFFDDLREHTADNPVVLLFDAYERCGAELRKWMETHLLAGQLNQQPHLLVVLAGRALPGYTAWDEDQITTYTRHIDELTAWDRDDIAAYLDAYDYTYTDDHLHLMGRMAEQGLPASLIVQTANAILRS